MINRDENGRPTEAFYAEAEPCESCGEPTSCARVWNAEYELWVAVDCSCNMPSAATCPLLIPELQSADTVSEVCRVIREHKAHCHLCQPGRIQRKEIAPAPGRMKEAA